jgi:hypothetical protein
MRAVALLLVVLLAPAATAGVPRACCFPVESLPADLRPLADELLWRLLDSEAVYTLAGGLKPVSDGFWQARFPADQATTPEVERVRAALGAFRCGGEVVAGVYVFDAVYDGKRSASAVVAHRPSLDVLLARRADVFAPLGVAPGANPQRVMEAVDRAPRATRWRAFGLLFGYPEHAVEFFVAAGESEKAGGGFVKRDFRTVPTWATDTGRFVYAVPKGSPERPEDVALKAAAAGPFATYSWRRPLYHGAGKPGPAVLVRDWFDDGTGCCSSFVPRGGFAR